MKEYKMKINGNDYAVTINEMEDEVALLEVNGTPYKVEFEKPLTKKSTVSAPVSRPRPAQAAAPAAAQKPAAASSAPVAGTTVTSPLPGVIIGINVKEGDAVKKGDKIMVLEAMKMENVIEATADGTVKSLKVKQGDSVLEGAPLAIIG